jgi:hypothetical protein
MHRRRLRWLSILVCCVAGAVFSSSASATPPDTFHVKDNGAGVFDFPAGVVCPFEVSVNFVQDDFEEIVYSDGVRRGAGVTVLYFTNVDTGETRRLVEGDQIIHRPLTSDIETTETRGPELSIFFPGDLGPGAPGAFLWIVGRSIEVDQFPGPNPNPFGATTLSFEVLSGSAENLCVTMA